MARQDVISNPITEVLEMVSRKRPASAALRDVEAVESELIRVRSGMERLLPIERLASDEFKAIETRLLRERLTVLSESKISDFPKFPMEALTWRDKNGFPRLAPFSLETPSFSIANVMERSWGRNLNHYVSTPSLPRELKKLYDDVFKLIRVMSKEERKTVRLRTQFTGLIPQSVKDQIVETKPLFKQLFVVAEVKKWALDKIAPIRRADPLLVGWDGYQLWLCASFDTTTTEKYIEKIALEIK